jgi:hypothetical protein
VATLTVTPEERDAQKQCRDCNADLTHDPFRRKIGHAVYLCHPCRVAAGDRKRVSRASRRQRRRVLMNIFLAVLFGGITIGTVVLLTMD